jgi:hypothetical protein
MVIMRYWGRKPDLIIEKIMKEVDGEVVDPFGGSGSIILTALRHGNRGIYLDINPYAWLVAYVNIIGADPLEYEEKVNEVLENLVPVRKRVLRYDYLRYRNGKPFWKREKVERVSQLFSHENFTKLYSILKAIDKVSATVSTKLALYGTFCSALFKASKMKRENAGSWGIPSYWTPEKVKEVDAIEAFKSEARRFLSYFKRNKRYELHKDVELYLGNALTFKFNNDSVLFTDPPFFDEIQYSELSFFYWAWLRESNFKDIVKMVINRSPRFSFKRELIVNPHKGMDYNRYLKMLEKFLRKTSKMKRKYLLFHYDKAELKDKVVELVKLHWGHIKIEELEIPNQRNIGKKGSKNYIIITYL